MLEKRRLAGEVDPAVENMAVRKKEACSFSDSFGQENGPLLMNCLFWLEIGRPPWCRVSLSDRINPMESGGSSAKLEGFFQGRCLTRTNCMHLTQDVSVIYFLSFFLSSFLS